MSVAQGAAETARGERTELGLDQDTRGGLGIGVFGQKYWVLAMRCRD